MRGIVLSGMVAVAGCSFVIGDRSTAPRADGTIHCTTSNTTALVDLALVALSAVSIEQGTTCSGFCVGAGTLVTAGAVVGIPGAISAVYGVVEANQCDDAKAAYELKAREVAAKAAKEHAWQLTLQAEQAARTDDCARVAALAPQIAALDTDMHDSVFRRDAGVIRCLSAAEGSGAR